MAVPRVFISSTFYDLKQSRNNIGDFIRSLGYEPVMHERSGVAYSQNVPLEKDCYHELASCDIAVCVIGNHFGSKSIENDLSITMNEIQIAIKNKKKVYIFISNDVYTENRTYLLNKDSGTFKSAYTDDIKIHEFIADLKNSIQYYVITPFETTNQIVETLRGQFAGLFQNLLQREANLTDVKATFDLQQSVDAMKSLISDFSLQKEEFFQKFDATIYTTNYALVFLKKWIGLNKASFFARDLESLDEFMRAVGFVSENVDNPFEDKRKYVHKNGVVIKTIIVKSRLFETNGIIRDIRSKQEIEELLVYKEDEDDEIPF